MRIISLEFSIVVVASDCNPTILNPDFLERTNIVPESWDWKVSKPVITTPPISIVTYNNSVSISVEPNKFQVVHSLFNVSPINSKCPDIAIKYIEVLPHVRYTSVGHNFQCLVELSNPEKFLMDRFLKSGKWNSKEHHLKEISLNLVYPIESGRLNVRMESATIKKVKEVEEEGLEEIRGILVYSNYHRDCEGYPSAEQIKGFITNVEKDWDHFEKITTDILEINHAS